MNHPCLVTLDSNSRPRVLLCGDRLVQVELPTGSDVLYPKPPRPSIADLGAAFDEAVSLPSSDDALAPRLRPGMKVTVALDDWCLSGLLERDPRQVLVERVLRLLDNHAVRDVEVVIATGLRRRLRVDEIKALVGPRAFSELWPRRLYNLDPEGPESSVQLGQTQHQDVLELSSRVAQSDLLIEIGIEAAARFPTLPVVADVCGYAAQRAFYNPDEPDVARARGESMLALIDRHVRRYVIRACVDNRMFGAGFECLTGNEDELSHVEWSKLRALGAATQRLPQSARAALFDRMSTAPRVIGVFAGDPAKVQRLARACCEEQNAVPVSCQADVLIVPISGVDASGPGSPVNPLQVASLAAGSVSGLWRGRPLLAPGGTLVVLHPCTDKFDREHSSTVDFVHRLLPETRDPKLLRERYEMQFARNPAFVEMFRQGHAFHPAHPFFMWYAAQAGLRHVGKVIVVGADNEYIPKHLGYETALNVAEALYRARAGKSGAQKVVCMHAPPWTIADLGQPSSLSSDTSHGH